MKITNVKLVTVYDYYFNIRGKLSVLRCCTRFFIMPENRFLRILISFDAIHECFELRFMDFVILVFIWSAGRVDIILLYNVDLKPELGHIVVYFI